MKFVIEKASDDDFREEREINTVDDLQKLAEEEHRGWRGSGLSKDLIVCFADEERQDPTIIIYDTWIE